MTSALCFQLAMITHPPKLTDEQWAKVIHLAVKAWSNKMRAERKMEKRGNKA